MDLLKTVCNIVKKGMNLSDDQIWIYNQKIDIPNDNRLYVVVSLKNESIFGNNIQYQDANNGLEEVIWTNLVSDVSIELFSYNTQALNRRYDILTSMRSTYSLQQQELYNMNISRQPTVFLDSSFASPTARLYSFYSEFRITHIEKNTRSVEYYDDFSRADMSNKENIKVNL